MITDFFLLFSQTVLELLLFLLPTSTGFPTEVSTAVAYFASYVGIVDPLLPLSTLHTIVLLTISIQVGILTFKMLRWLVSFIPFVGGRV